MFVKKDVSNQTLEMYEDICLQLEVLLEDGPNLVANLSNTSALLNVYLENINWVGFYLMNDGQLQLGPFQGLPACTRIEVGKGVCGTAVATKEIQRVEDVHLFPGHIACDGASESEIVLPIMKDNEVFGVLDIDSPIKNRFSTDDQEGLIKVVALIEKYLDK